jgi:putative tryptophan/tyrosine transport system substrate-binding protein
MRRIPLAVILALTVSLVVASFAGEAQSTASIRKIGFLSVSAAPESPKGYPYLAGFRQGLRDLGWIEGQNLAVEYRWAAGRIDALPSLARELVGLNVEMIVTYGNKPPHVLKDIVKTTPIVALSCDPLETMVTSLARPSGNITGVTCLSSELTAKRLELLLEAVPRAKRVAILYNPGDPGPTLALRFAQEFAASRKVTIEPVAVVSADEFDHALGAVAQLHPDALYVYPDPLTARFAKTTIEFAAKQRMPAIYGFRQWPDAGGLMSYGSNLADLAYRGAGHVDKILRGAKPADLPVEQPTKFELVINPKTAKALGLTIPQSILTRADEIIQ